MASQATDASKQAILDSICCPIMGTPMRDPVQGNDGHTYERSAITKWLTEKKALSPMTNQPMTVDSLKVNANIRYLCDQYHSGAFGTTNYKKSAIIQNNPGYEISEKARCYPFKSDGSMHIPAHDGYNLHLKFEVTNIDNLNTENTPPCDLVLVVDRSGSTDASVEAQGEGGAKLEVGYSILDIIKHAVKTVAHSVRDCDRIAVVIFDNNVETIVQLQNMTEINRSTLCARIENVQPGGTTNLYGGIIEANNILRNRDDKTRNTAILALTDGQPNVRPSRGEVHSLTKMQDENLLEGPVHTFGFGYNLEKGLLYDIAKVTNATTGHIPDGGMIGTVFSNYLAMILTTACTNIKLHIKSRNFNISNPVIGDLPYSLSDNSETLTINVGSLQFQQSRDVCICINNDSKVEYYYSYDIGGKTHYVDDKIVKLQTPNTNIHDDYTYQLTRSLVSNQLRQAINCRNKNHMVEIYGNIIELIQSNQTETTEIVGKIAALEDTMTDQVYLAIGSQQIEHANYYNKWGEFYLDQLSTALLKQYTPNFKDKACMVFGGVCSKQFMEHAADTFDTLPPPKPTKKVYDYSTGSYRGGTGVASMAVYNNASGGCWTGSSSVLMANGTTKLACEIVPGDLIATMTFDESGPVQIEEDIFTSARVLHTVETEYDAGKINLVSLQHKSAITPWHPIYVSDNADDKIKDWQFPVSLGPSQEWSCDKLYNLILDTSHVAIIGGTPCITLGHNYTHGILKHPYFGTKKVIDDLLPFNNNGVIKINSKWFIKDGPDLDGSGFKTISGISKKIEYDLETIKDLITSAK